MVVRKKTGWLASVVAAGGLMLAAPLMANVRDGVDAWSRGDYAAAVAQWQGPAAAGDADAQFNLAQAYRLGRGVPADMAEAEDLYRRAAAAGHVQAADTYGLMLFQDGRRDVALPYVQAAARRGDPRAQYLLGIAHFNGDLVAKDWERAYALLTLSNAQGLPQAGAAIAQMDQHIPLADRQRGAELAQRLQAEADSARAVEMAQFDLGTSPATASAAAPAVTPAVASAARPAIDAASARVPRAIPTTAVSPSVAAARAAVAEASRATGTESPANAGATFASSTAPSQPAVAAASAPAPARVAASAAPARAAGAPAAMTGPWKVQLGAFSVAGNAERLWSRVAGRSELAGAQRLLVPTGRVTRLLAGGYASRAAADAACGALKRGGHDCIVTQN